MADAMSMELIAEGVERQEQSDWLLHAGVPEAQGWLFAKAMPADEFLKWVAFA
jgi:sensor c-di-GMP phosphodiesterase-like protein